MKCCLLLFVVGLVTGIDVGPYRQDGDFIIGAIIPLTKTSDKGVKCGEMNAAGVTLAETIVHALEQVGTENEFKSLVTKKPIGYDIRDSCGELTQVKKHALDMARESFDFKRGISQKKPIQVVISEFGKDTAGPVLPVLTSYGIVQVSYSSENARLQNDESISEDSIKNLVSVFPEYTKKMLAVVDLILDFGFDHIFAVASGDNQGKTALNLLSTQVAKYGICKSESLYVSDKSQVSGVLDKIAEYPRITVVVVHCTSEVELALYAEASKRNMTDLIFISTQNWQPKIDLLKPYARVLEGMISVEYKKDSNNFKVYIGSRKPPHTDRDWLKRLFVANGGNASCLNKILTKRDKSNEACFTVADKVRDQLVANTDLSVYAYDSIYAIVFALKKSVKESITLLEATKGLQFRIPLMSANQIVFTDEFSVETSKFKIYSLLGNTQAKFESKWLGQWDQEIIEGRPLLIRKAQVVWKEGSKETPTSVCSESCAPGLKRSFLDSKWKCCWECVKCANQTVSSVSNSDVCVTCGEGEVPHPNQSACVKYKLLYFKWFGTVGSLIIVLMVIGVVLVLFALAIFSQNSTHELVQNANYNSLSFFLLAILLLLLVPIPLLITPTQSSCFTYIALLNIALSMVLGVLMSRSAYINGFFDDNGQLNRGSCGPFPRALVVLVVVIAQVIVTLIAYQKEDLQTMHNETDQWDARYHECSSWTSQTFWAGFIFNMVISVIGNSMSCSSVKVEDNSFELKHILLSHLFLYMVGIMELCIFFRSTDEHLAGGQAVCSILFAYAFFFCYVWPKIYIILFRSKGDKAIEKPLLEGEDDGVMTTAIHASAGFKNQGIVQMKIRDADV